MNLQYKITLVLSLMLLVVFGAMALMIGEHFQDTLENQMGNNAMDMAVTIAQMDDVEQTLAYKLDYMPLHDKNRKNQIKNPFPVYYCHGYGGHSVFLSLHKWTGKKV